MFMVIFQAVTPSYLSFLRLSLMRCLNVDCRSAVPIAASEAHLEKAVSATRLRDLQNHVPSPIRREFGIDIKPPFRLPNALIKR